MIHMEECTVERTTAGWSLLDIEGDVTATIPYALAKNEEDATMILEQVAKGYNKGHEHGEFLGRLKLQSDLRDLLDAARSI